ncbi:hypothetical protein C1646_675834 [Rhizophagus diaphanus]|nr:hypothetical protein C1646_675834 [Rhizophagus diaphanus] [Rhizophagus sp. MUCL 43196]
MEWYHMWKAEYESHKQKHDEGTIELSECLSCETCHSIKGQFTKEPENSESDKSKNSPESYEFEEGASDGYEIMEEDGIEWSVDLLKRKIGGIGGKFTDEDIQRIWNLRIRIKLVLTEDFLSVFFERKNLSNEKLKDEMKDWLE